MESIFSVYHNAMQTTDKNMPPWVEHSLYINIGNNLWYMIEFSKICFCLDTLKSPKIYNSTSHDSPEATVVCLLLFDYFILLGESSLQLATNTSLCLLLYNLIKLFWLIKATQARLYQKP